MEYLILLAALLVIWVIVSLKGLWDSKRMGAWQRRKVKESFGKRSEREYAAGEFESIPRFFERHQEGFFIDDITWNDLNMDEIFRQMNVTASSAGQEYLYYMLRTPSMDQEELDKREELIRYFTEHEEERLNVQMLYHRMGRTGKYSIYDYLDFLDALGERNSTLQLILDLAYIPAAVLLGINVQAGLLALIALIGVNVSTYLKEKRAIEPYLISFRYVFRVLDMAQRLCKEKVPVLKRQQEELRALQERFAGLKRSAALGMRSMGDGGSPLDLVMDYLNMIFHFDILSFNRMVHQLRDRSSDIDEMLMIVGRIEAMIAAAGYRQSLPGWCVPQFVPNGMTGQESAQKDTGHQEMENAGRRRAALAIKQLYHPLLTDPVRNDIVTEKSVLLTGSNASGKSTFLKAVALNALFAQTIHTCCADSYRGSLFYTMTSMALRDDLVGGESYYIVEIKSIKRILSAADNADAPVLCFVDEVLRGTNTVERIAASTQILKSLSRTEVCCFAATHDIELTQLLQDRFTNYHFEEEISEGDIRFPYKLMEGKATSRNAIKLLAIMGYDASIIEDAEAMAERFVERGSWE